MEIEKKSFKSMNAGTGRSVIISEYKAASTSKTLSIHKLSLSQPTLVLLHLGCVALPLTLIIGLEAMRSPEQTPLPCETIVKSLKSFYQVEDWFPQVKKAGNKLLLQLRILEFNILKLF